MFDVPGVIEKEFVGRGAGKTTPLVCGNDGNATLIQLNQPLQQHSHDDADEFIYVVAGEGAASLQGTSQKLKAGTLLFVPRGHFARAHRLWPEPPDRAVDARRRRLLKDHKVAPRFGMMEP